MSKHYSPNDMRSMAMNPTSSHYAAAMNNQSNMHNSNNTTLDHNNVAYKAVQDNRSQQIASNNDGNIEE